MNKFMVSTIIAVTIALLCVVTRPKNPETESNGNFAVKVALVSFVCSYFTLVYFASSSCPEIDVGEPDF
jgi:hypothetical protein